MNDDFICDAFELLIEMTREQTHPESKAQAYALELARLFCGDWDMDKWPEMSEEEKQAFISGYVPKWRGYDQM